MELVGLKRLSRPARRIVTTIAIALALAMILPAAWAAPRVPKESCAAVMDYAGTASSAAAAGVDRAKADVMLGFIYTRGDDEGERLKKLVADAAYRMVGEYKHPIAFITAIGRNCMFNGGNLDAILGADS
jgi:hypothetical protein